jgi:hypothetical protein
VIFRITTDAVALCSHPPGPQFVKKLKSGLVSFETDLALKLVGRNPLCVRRDEVASQNQIDSGVWERSITVPAASQLSRWHFGTAGRADVH